MCTECHSEHHAQTHTHAMPRIPKRADVLAATLPPIMNSLLFQAKTHQIDDIPNAETGVRFRRQENPNACLQCQAGKKPPGWKLNSAAEWPADFGCLFNPDSRRECA